MYVFLQHMCAGCAQRKGKVLDPLEWSENDVNYDSSLKTWRSGLPHLPIFPSLTSPTGSSPPQSCVHTALG